MKKRYLILSMITFLAMGPLFAFGMECEVPPFINQVLEPNILIIHDTSGSMNNLDWIDGYDRSVDHTVKRLPIDEEEVVFVKAPGSCQPDPGRITYSGGRVTLEYVKARSGQKDPCVGGIWDSAQSDASGYFYFDREDGEFDDDDEGTKIFLPYLTDRTVWVDSDYLNWVFYDSTKAQRDDLKNQYDDPNRRDLLTRHLAAKKVMTDLVQATNDVRFGLMYFDEARGGKIEALVSSDKQPVLDALGGAWANGRTPLAEALEDAWDYFSDSANSPIQYWCQKNFVILMTDGYPVGDADDLGALKGDWDNDHGGNEEDLYPSGGSDYLDDIAYYIYENDSLDLPGKQNIYTFTIGFTVANDLLKDTAFNGNGLAGHQAEWDNPDSINYRRYFYTAKNYSELNDAITATINEIINKIASGTAVAVQSTSTEGKKRLLRAKFLPDGWRGYLEAFELPYTQGEAPLWEAGAKLKDRDEGDRYIFTAVDDKKGPKVEMKRKLEFTEAMSATQDAEKVTLSDMLGAVDDAEAKKIIRYVRGATIGGYRDRMGWKLGDITYSTPVISGDMAFVGGNDGMLHAFDVDTGEEKWAFIPNNLLPKLKDLTRLDYCHEYFVDLSPTVAKIYVGGILKKVLVGGERGGGDAFFALDITDPSPDGVQPMWQFSDPYLGESWTFPYVERCWLKDAERWVAFIGSAFGNKDTKGYLFAVDVVTGQQMGTQLLLSGSPDNMMANIRAIDSDYDGFADRVFVGCMQEKLFVVEIGPGDDPKFWKSSHILTTGLAGNFQPITVPTSLSLYREAGETHVMAYFGTGKYYNLDDRTDLSLQSFYAVKENAVKVGRGGLADQTDAAVCSDILGGFGWYIDLVEGPGERVISSALVAGGYVFFVTFQPSDDPCEAGGIARLYVVNYDSGCVPAVPVVDINGDGIVDENDKIDGAVPRNIEIGYGVPSDVVFNPSEGTIIIQTSDTTIHQFKVNLGNYKLTVHSWREVLD